MPTFPGKIGFVDDTSKDMSAEITIDGQSLEITTGETSIGSWPIAGIELELGARGYVATLDGEQLVLAPHDRFGFTVAVEEAQEAAAEQSSRRGARKKAKQDKKAAAAAVKQAEAEAKAAAKAEAKAEAKSEKKRPSPPESDEQPAEKDNKRERRREEKAAAKALKAARKQEPTEREPEPIHVPGLEDPDKDALWATHRTGDGASWRERLNSATAERKVYILAVVGVLIAAYFIPTVVSFLLLIPGVVAVVLAGLALLDPAYTRFLPGSFTETRLMIVGISFFVSSLAVATIF